MHIHEVIFQVVNRQPIFVDEAHQAVQVVSGSAPQPPQPWENGFKDTVIAYPGQVTRVRAKFEVAVQFVWHCHIVEHEDNEMMRPYSIGPIQTPGMAATVSAASESANAERGEFVPEGLNTKVFIPFVSN